MNEYLYWTGVALVTLVATATVMQSIRIIIFNVRDLADWLERMFSR